MKNPIGAIESALMKRPNVTQGVPGQSNVPSARQPQTEANAAQADIAPADFDEVVNELTQLVLAGKLPADFDLEQACMDPAFAALIAEFPAEAALRIYYAENMAARAEQTAMQRVSRQVQSRNALPRSARGGAMSAPTPNYADMDDATFRKLLAEIKRAARNGKSPRL